MNFFTKFCFILLFGISFCFAINTDEAKAEKVKVVWGKIEVQPGHIGRVTFLKDTNIYKTDKNGKPAVIKNVKKGSEMAVFQINNKLLNGAYVLNNSTYVKISENVKYEVLPPNKKELVGKDRVWITASTVESINGGYVNIPNLTEAYIIEAKSVKDAPDFLDLKVKINSKYYYMTVRKLYREKSYLDYNPFKRYKSLSKEVWKDIKERKVSIGMDIFMVELSWGRPDDINEYSNAYGTIRQWIYGDVLKGATYLYFNEDFILTSWQD
jgi:hypothetical protein